MFAEKTFAIYRARVGNWLQPNSQSPVRCPPHSCGQQTLDLPHSSECSSATIVQTLIAR